MSEKRWAQLICLLSVLSSFSTCSTYVSSVHMGVMRYGFLTLWLFVGTSMWRGGNEVREVLFSQLKGGRICSV